VLVVLLGVRKITDRGSLLDGPHLLEVDPGLGAGLAGCEKESFDKRRLACQGMTNEADIADISGSFGLHGHRDALL
jgi:hypothetical protein